MECEVSKDLLRSSRPIMLFELHMQLELYAICWALDLERWEVGGGGGGSILVGKIRI